LDENTVTFTNTTQFGETYYWDFGDGNFSEDENPIHTYDTDDAYDVSLVATNECGTFTVNETVSISNLPFANFSSNVTNGCAEFIVEFENNSSSNSDTYQWTFEGGNPGTSSLENPVITYSTTGVYNVQLIVSNEEGSDELLQNNYITVEDVPNALYSFTNNQLEYSFENLSTDGDSYFWEFGDGENSALVNPLHTYVNSYKQLWGRCL
jgi:PKD repeat protein